jgi:hypothetical protein
MDQKIGKLVHVAVAHIKGKGKLYLFLRQIAEHHYGWFLENKEDVKEGYEITTEIGAPTIAESLRAARKEWIDSSFRMLMCGFRYNLPERDEHGENALFYQMAASYGSSNGVYFDELAGHNCIVHNASAEAKELLGVLNRKAGVDVFCQK